MEIQVIHEWVMSLSANYNVNPYIFAAIYLGAIPFFTASVAWLIRNKRKNRPLTLPILSTGFWLTSAYLYLIIAGDNVPFWVYMVIFGLLGLGTYSTMKKINGKRKDITL
ncbi:hypothetical protein NC796_01105 [Aliifodinibius sp. S!AR15-10]|uniref:hypothetical protein n=1 Tax=Aliifodinibius sp. S!AR15-10 TaxID=2950437 RepID=UPI002862E879|nr:hypothetical protein [Aliifodinibius sp. S!AR15-10]MDR8389713.1 hypothetical protein [Aliifodinibius sp. S!AR15-10]